MRDTFKVKAAINKVHETPMNDALVEIALNSENNCRITVCDDGSIGITVVNADGCMDITLDELIRLLNEAKEFLHI